MIPDDQRARIRRLFFAEHWKIGTIAAELGVHHDTVELAIELVVPLPGFIKRRAEGKIIGTALRELKRKVESDEATRGVASSE